MAGRGRLRRSKLGSGTDDTGMSFRSVPPGAPTRNDGVSVPLRSVGSTENASPNPAIWSTSGSSAASSSPYRSAIQPVTTNFEPSLRCSCRAKIVSIDS